jgi:lipopolysaccharide transport system permease protein
MIKGFTSTAAEARGRLRRWFDVIVVLTRSDLRTRYGRGALRWPKLLMDPFAALGIYLLLVAFVLDQSEDAAGLSIACAIVPFQVVIATIANGLRAFDVRGSILLNMRFPKTLIPVSSVITESVAFSGSLVLLPLMMIAYGVEPTLAVGWLPVVVAVTLLLAVAAAYPATLFGIWYPDLSSFAVSLVRALFFIAPGLVALDQITGTARDLLPLNPLTGLFESFRDTLLYGQAPEAWELLTPLLAAVIVLAIAVPVFRREAPFIGRLIG